MVEVLLRTGSLDLAVFSLGVEAVFKSLLRRVIHRSYLTKIGNDYLLKIMARIKARKYNLMLQPSETAKVKLESKFGEYKCSL